MSEDLKNSQAETESTDIENKRETYPIKTFKAIEPFVGNVYKKYGNSDILSNEKLKKNIIDEGTVIYEK